MHICVCCCTYLRPRQLGYVLRCFQRQTYADREMVVLDDAGQYGDQRGDRWRLVSVGRRFASLGEKRNACAALASPDAAAFAVWDDDDLYLPWALEASARALERTDWSRPSQVLHPVEAGGRWHFRRHQTGGLYHGGWAYRREVFERLGGYAAGYSGPEDQEFMARLEAAGAVQADPIALGWRPFYIYPWGQGSAGYHISGMLSGRDQGQAAWRRLGRYAVDRAAVVPADPPWFDLDAPLILGGVHPRPF
jgi:hypothetical protein